MAKKLNSTIGINLAFTADTDKAKRQMRELQSMLENLSTKSITNSPLKEINNDLLKAANSATKLQTQLAMATNPDTGKLDLTKFNDALKKSNMSLEDYQTDLFHLGSDGVKAFSQLAQAITLAEVPMRRANKLVDEMWTSLKNTARWQFSSSILHGLVGAVQSAYGYAQDLNESLNNIRIVTGQSVEQMADFAKEANKAAKALSTTTTEYTKASLIYYQQGLSDKEVKDRTDITIKMANAAGQSAETVSDQLTAVWNNFYDGSKSLEYYADVMTALGAATASSTEEISTGLNKFAAIAETVGLSYEYAASALATVTATTRQSADIVGTAFKTLFARIQDLELGKTLDDGTTLGKYSAALNTIGVNIKDDNDNLKEMDQILEEMAEKWKTISKDEQTAVAQTVAGTRQYTQLVALMENWDFMQQNLGTSYGATGTLNEQAEIYAESWEAAKDRVQASMETIYDTIINDEFFIDLSNGFAKALEGVNAFINGLGGAKGILLTIGSLATSILAHKISGSIQTMIHNVKMQFPSVREKEIQSKTEATKVLVGGLRELDTSSGRAMADAYEQLGEIQTKYTENVKNMSEEEQYVNKILMDRGRILADNAIVAAEAAEEAEKSADQAWKNLYNKAPKSNHNQNVLDKYIYKEKPSLITSLKNQQILTNLSNIQVDEKSDANIQTRYKQTIANELLERASIKSDTSEDSAKRKLASTFGFGKDTDKAEKFVKILRNVDDSSLEQVQEALKAITAQLDKETNTEFEKLRKQIKKLNDPELQAAFDELEQSISNFGDSADDAARKSEKLSRFTDEHKKSLDKIQEKPMKLSEAFSRMTGAVMAVGQAITTVTGIIDVFNDENATTKDKVIALIGGLTMLVPTITSLIPAFTGVAAAGGTATVALWPFTLAVMALTAVIAGVVVAIDAVKKRSPEGQLKRTKEEAKKLAEELDEIKNKTQEIKSVFDQYDDVVNKLDNCVKGTAEWKAALQDVNKVVLDLMATYPELLSMPDLFTRDSETGMLTINEEKRNEVLELQNQRELNKQAQVLWKNIEVNKQDAALAVNNDIKNLNKKLDYTITAGGETASTSLALSNILTDKNILDLEGYTESEQKAYLIDAVKKALGNEAYHDVTEEEIQAFADSIGDLRPIIDEYATEVERISNSIRNANQLIVDSMLGESATADEKAIFANYLESEKQNRYNDFKNLAGVSNRRVKDRDELEDQWEQYAKINGITDDRGLANNAVIKRDGETYIQYLNSEGKKETVSAKDFYNSLALDDITTNKDTLLKEYQSKLSIMRGAAGENEADGVSQLISNQNFEGFSAKKIKEMNNIQASSGGIQNFIESFGYSNIRDYASAIGLNTEGKEDRELYKEILLLLKDANTAIESLPNKFSQSVRDEFQSMNFEQLNVAQQDQVGQMMQNAFNVSGEDGLNTITNFFEDLNLKEMETFLGTSFDWASMSAADLKVKFQELGIVIDEETEEKLPELIEVFKKQLNPGLKEIQNQVKNQQDVVKGLKNLGDTISSEDFDKLGEQYRDYFQLMADGSYKLIKSAELLNKELNKTYQQQLISNIESNENKATLLSNVARNKDLGISTSVRAQGEVLAALGLLNEETFSVNDLAELREHGTNGLSSEKLAELQRIFDTIDIDTLYNQSEIATNELNNSIESLGSISTLKELQNWRKDSDILADNEAYQTALLGLMSSATNFESVDYILKNSELDQTSNDYLTLQANALINLGSAYDSCAYEIERVQQLMEEDPNSPMLKVAIQALSTAVEAQTKIQEISHSDIYDVDRQYGQDLEDLNEEIEKANEKIDEGIGASVIGSFETIATTLDKKTDLIKEKIKENSTEISKSQQKLLDITADGIDGGFTFTFNEDGTISNYDDYMSALTDAYVEASGAAAINPDDVQAKDEAAKLKAIIDQLNEYIPAYDKLVDSNKKANEELDKTSKEKIQNTIEKFEKAQDDFDSYVDTLESYKDVMALVHGEANTENITKAIEGIHEINQSSLQAAKDAYNALLATEGHTQEQLASARAKILDEMKNWAESLKAVILDQFEGFDKQLEEAIVGEGMTFNEIVDNMERAQSLQEEYLTDTNKVYEVNKLINDAQKQVDITTNTVAKQKLKNFIEQTKELEKQNKLSKFELDIRKAEYDVMLAEIALQEAQQAKSAVRLRRDSEGNFGYVYTADANQVADAEQRLADAENALYNIQLDGANNYAQKQQQILSESIDKMKSIREAYLNGEIETEDEYNRQIGAIREYALAKYEEYNYLMGKAAIDGSAVANEAWALSVKTSFGDIQKAFEDWEKTSSGSLEKYHKDIGTMVGSGSNLSTFGISIGEATTNAKNLAAALGGGGSTATKSDIPPVNEAVEDYGEKAKEAVDTGGEDLKQNLNDAADNADKLTSSILGNEEKDGLEGALQKAQEYAEKAKDAFETFKTVIQQTIGEVSALGRNLLALNDKHATVRYEVIQTLTTIDGNSQATGYHSDLNVGSRLPTDPKQAIHMDTGGYTGQWGAAGKLAVLHEKEIVLNQDDTVNLLASIELLRGIVDTLDVQTASQMMGGILTSPGYNNNYSNPIEQNVKIEASFPAVQDRNEIEEAFNNLINKASQYANRK